MAGLYIHIPYCHSKCSYCDFYSSPLRETIDNYIDALIAELRLRYNEIDQQYNTVYIGGGTPSILTIEQLAQLVSGISEYINICNLQEFTIEANPEDVTDEWCREVIDLGITRVSMGIQSFIDSELKIINRRHTSQDALNAIETMLRNGITEISGDLIYGLPTQTLDSWKYSLNQLLELNLPHISAYLLSYEPGTRLYTQLKHGKITETDEELAQSMYQLLIKATQKCGYEHYEISNFSKPRHHALHNSNYWRDLPYLGLGASAHSFDGNNRRFNANNIKEYISSINNGNIYATLETETIDERHNDYIIVALRTANGINLNDYHNKWGNHKYERLISIAQPFIDAKQMIINNNHLAIAESEMLVSDRIMIEFII